MSLRAAETKQAERILSESFAQVFRAYSEAPDDVQAVIRDMCAVINAPETDPDDREAAVATLVEALFPTSYDGSVGVDIEDLGESLQASSDFRDDVEALDAQDSAFAERLKAIMHDKGMTQAQLASAIGVQQPAISMMLSRRCHPQRSTVEKLAAALGITPSELWPPHP
ncbi:MAG: helix-turn-helix transcriptional regulator [Phycisphaerae bacterium]|jgi:predicted XRE-type DNA-binding protein